MTLEDWQKLLLYNSETGEFRWQISPSNRVRIGDIAGSINTRGYRNVSYKSVYCGTHRLAWLFAHEEWPDGHIDHINGNCSDNRICNLRIATSSQNCFNRKRQKRNKSGFKGVVRRKYAWEASIMKMGKLKYLGHFKTPEEAHTAYLFAARELHGEFARGE
jgi:hypothetical protein